MGDERTHLATWLHAALLSGVMLLGGCTIAPAGASRDTTPAFYRRSLAFDSKPQRRMHRQLGDGSGTTAAWWEDRNDRQPYVESGYRSAVFERTVTYTRDRQRTTSGNVDDQYLKRSRTEQSFEVVR